MGPYICAEWDNGGFPLWLSALKTPAKPLHADGWMRSDDPVFLMWTKHWFDAVCPIIAKHQNFDFLFGSWLDLWYD